MDNLIEASGVVKRYDGHTALDGVDQIGRAHV